MIAVGDLVRRFDTCNPPGIVMALFRSQDGIWCAVTQRDGAAFQNCGVSAVSNLVVVSPERKGEEPPHPPPRAGRHVRLLRAKNYRKLGMRI